MERIKRKVNGRGIESGRKGEKGWKWRRGEEGGEGKRDGRGGSVIQDKCSKY